MVGIVKVALVALAATATVSTSIALTAGGDRDRAVVTNLVDGDTLDVAVDGRTTRIRLLNVDTPETVDPARDVQCLGPEASAFLASLVPVGTTVTLEYDRVRTDRRGRTLAAVFTADDVLVNAEIARQGLAAAVVVDGNDRFHPPVERARDEAADARRGLFAENLACAAPAQVAGAEAAATAAPGADRYPSVPVPGDVDGPLSEVAAAAAVVAAVERDVSGGDPSVGWRALPDGERDRLSARVRGARKAVDRKDAELRTVAQQARDREAAQQKAEREAAQREAAGREAAERVAALREEAARKAAELRAQGEAAQRKAEREAAQREAEQRKAAQREAAQREAAQRETAQREAEQRKAAQREAAQRETAQRKAEQQEAARREAARRQAAEREAQQQRDAGSARAERERPGAGSPGSGGNCEPGYSPCVPLFPPDLDCGDLPPGPYVVTGSDPHRLDNDDPDNLGCE